jgi:hypothetical protein
MLSTEQIEISNIKLCMPPNPYPLYVSLLAPKGPANRWVLYQILNKNQEKTAGRNSPKERTEQLNLEKKVFYLF